MIEILNRDCDYDVDLVASKRFGTAKRSADTVRAQCPAIPTVLRCIHLSNYYTIILHSSAQESNDTKWINTFCGAMNPKPICKTKTGKHCKSKLTILMPWPMVFQPFPQIQISYPTLELEQLRSTSSKLRFREIDITNQIWILIMG